MNAAALASLLLACGACRAQAQVAEPMRTLPPVEVVGQTPLPGIARQREQFPGNVQRADDADLGRARNFNLVDFMNRRLEGVTVNETQGSPFQADLSYRGHRLSPTLGAAQGLSAYLDGVRINEPFGDVISWDMLPESAIASIVLMPGSNPLYGLNTLGGALVLTTKSGLTHKGTELDVSIGSFGRRRLDFGHGRQWEGGWHAYVAGTFFSEQGWREQSPGRLGNALLKIGRQQAATEWTLSYLQGESRLTGNGLLSESLYRIDRRAGYTFSDTTRNSSRLLSLALSHKPDARTQLAWLGWMRKGNRAGSNGDVREEWTEWLGQCVAGQSASACSDSGDPGFISNNAIINRTQARQTGTGTALQWTHTTTALRFALGVELSRSRIGYEQFTQEGSLDGGRLALLDPVAPLVRDVGLRGRSSTAGVYATGIMEMAPRTHLTLSARRDRTRVTNELSGQPVESFTYGKLNPAVGITHSPGAGLSLFANVSQGTRVPTSLELGCADAARPCVLPTGLQSDPYLKQVVARTVEAGVRAIPWERGELAVALFRTQSRDDIAFVRSGISQAGYFTNVGPTLRQGMELSARGRDERFEWHAGYTFLHATYRSAGVLQGPLSTAAMPNTFGPGTPIAGLPRHTWKAGAEWRAGAGVRFGADVLAVSSQGVAGNESASQPGLGRLAGYATLNLRASWEITTQWLTYIRVNNALDRRYATFATGNRDLFPNGRALQPGDDVAASRFVAPGAGRSVTLGARYEWDL